MKHQNAQSYIYLVFSSTTNAMGRMIRAVTHYEYNHVSVSFSPTLCPMFSFARYYKDTPLYGGFVTEESQRFEGDSKHGSARVTVCAVPLNERQLRRAKQYVGSIERRRDIYIYNTVAAMTFPLGFDVQIEHAMTCIEFAINVLRRAAAPLSNRIPAFCTIRRLEELYRPYVIYSGRFPAPPSGTERADSDSSSDSNSNSDYAKRHSVPYRLGHTLKNFGKLLGRMTFGNR